MRAINLQDSKLWNEAPDEEVIDLRHYWRTVMRYRWRILGFSFVATLLTALVVFSIEPQYRSAITLLIESSPANVVSIEEVYGLDEYKYEHYLTQFEILKSRSLAEKVIRKYQLVSHPEFNRQTGSGFNWRAWLASLIPEVLQQQGPEKTLTEEQILQDKVSLFVGRVSVETMESARTAAVSFDAYDPGFAAQMANALGEAYIEFNLESKMEASAKASTWLNERLGGLRIKLAESEQKLQAFRDREQIVGDRGGLDIAGSELDLVASRLVDVRRKRLEYESLHREINAIGNNGSQAQNYERIPEVLAHPVVQSYKQAVLNVEQKKSELAKRYGHRHPKMIAVNSELSSARSALDRQIKSVITGIENQYRVAQSNERSLEQTLNKTKRQIHGITGKEFQLGALEKEVETNRQLYDTFFIRLNETAATSGLEMSDARILDRSVIPRRPHKPKKRLIVALGFAGSMMFGVMCAFLLEGLNQTIRGPIDVEEKLGQTMLGLLPMLKGDSQKLIHHHYIEQGKSGFAEAMRTIRTSIVLSALDNPHKTIMVTSTVAEEGKTTTALNLAYALGQMERVLFIEADMRRPSLHKFFKFGNNSPGLSNLIAGTSPAKNCVHTLEKEGIDIMLAGLIPPNPLELLASRRFAKVLKVMETRYDRIIIDCPPCQAVSDPLLMAPKVDSVLYIVKADSTPVGEIKNALQRLYQAKGVIIGVVVNQVNIEKAARYYSEGYYGYYDVHGYGASSPSDSSDIDESNKDNSSKNKSSNKSSKQVVT